MTPVRSRRVLVTGATGFLGAYVCPALTAAGWIVRAAVRDPRQSAPAHEQVVVGDLTDAAAWQDALEDVEAVVHLAGLAHQGGSAKDYLRVNRDGSAALAHAAAGRVCSFVHVSTALVHGSSSDGRGPFRKSDPLLPRSPYAVSKAKAEELVAAIAASSGMTLTILRPPLIYGRNAKGNFAAVARLLRAGIPLPLASIHNRRAFVAAETVADAIHHTIGGDRHGIRTFLLADREQVSTAEFARLTGEALGCPARLFRAPPALLKLGLRATGKARLGNSLLASLELDTSLIRQAGWEPPLAMRDALRGLFGPPGSNFPDPAQR